MFGKSSTSSRQKLAFFLCESTSTPGGVCVSVCVCVCVCVCVYIYMFRAGGRQPQACAPSSLITKLVLIKLADHEIGTD